MSEENVEIVREIYEAFARRDNASVFKMYAEDVVWDLSNAGRAMMLSQRIYHGHEGVRQAWRDGFFAFRELNFEIEELRDLGDRVLATVRERDVGRTSGAQVEMTHAAVWTLANGKVTRMQLFDDRQQALEAAGLRE